MSKVQRKRPRLNTDTMNELIQELRSLKDTLPDPYGSYEEDEEGNEISSTEPGQIESEEVEVSISALVSTISSNWDTALEPSSLSDLLTALFSSADDVVSLAVNFEDAVNGYFGELFGENLNIAGDYLAELITTLEERRDKWKERRKG